MASHRALVDEFYRRMNELDLAIADMCTPDVEWHWPSSTPGTDVFRGRDQMTEGLETWTESWGELHFDVDEIVEDGDWVLVTVNYRMRGAASGLALEHTVAHVHEYEEGKLRRWWMFGDADKARRRFLAGDRPG